MAATTVSTVSAGPTEIAHSAPVTRVTAVVAKPPLAPAPHGSAPPHVVAPSLQVVSPHVVTASRPVVTLRAPTHTESLAIAPLVAPKTQAFAQRKPASVLAVHPSLPSNAHAVDAPKAASAVATHVAAPGSMGSGHPGAPDGVHAAGVPLPEAAPVVPWGKRGGAYVRNGTRDPAKDGSNGGQWFKDSAGGDWFGKPGKGDAHEIDRLGNEHAINRIYHVTADAFGTRAPEQTPAMIDGKPYLMSKKLSLANQQSFGAEQMKRFGDGFVVDAWLANWDIGGSWQLFADASGHMVRIDSGGGGLFRARGEPKGDHFGTAVTELQSMRDPAHATSHAFQKLSNDEVKSQLQKFAAWYPAHRAEVDRAIDGSGMSPPAAFTLKTKLAARAAWLIDRAQSQQAQQAQQARQPARAGEL